jgi:hypothetical protein
MLAIRRLALYIERVKHPSLSLDCTQFFGPTTLILTAFSVATLSMMLESVELRIPRQGKLSEGKGSVQSTSSL